MAARSHVDQSIPHLITCLVLSSLLRCATSIAPLPLNHRTTRLTAALPRRQLQSSLPLPTASDAHLDGATTFKVQSDWVPDSLDVPYPELYYQDLEDGTRKLIWAFDDTLPRDLLAGRSEVWLHATIDVDQDAALLPHFLEHYSRLGISPDRMLITLRSEHGKLDFKNSFPPENAVLNKVIASLTVFGADYRVWLGRRSLEAALHASLLAVRRVPIKDWVVVVDAHEFVDFGDLTAQQFLRQKEREGANWVSGSTIEAVAPSGLFEPITASLPTSLTHQFSLSCNLTRISSKTRQKVIAYRGYLRPDALCRSIVPAETAAAYFGPTANKKVNLRDGGTCGTKDLYYLTPYYTYWQYYKTPLMVGNAFLWYDRQADGVALLYRYRWHQGTAAAARVAEGRHKRRCEGPPALEEAIFEKIARQGRVNVQGGDLSCTAAVEEQPKRLPLSKSAAMALARVLEICKS